MSRFPSYSLKQIGKLLDVMHKSSVLSTFPGEGTLTGGEIKELSRAFSEPLPAGVKWKAIYQSCLYLSSTTLTEEEMHKLCWRLAGNVRRLKAGKPAPPWTHQSEDEWMPLQVVESVPRFTERGRPGCTLYLRVLAGTACPLIIQKFWTRRFCGFIAKDLGFTASYGDRPFTDVTELTGLRFCGLFTRDLCQGRPGFDKIHVPPSIKSHNRGMISRRSVDLRQCPMNHDTPCHFCPIGYSECPLGTKPRTYILETCSVCKAKTWIDPTARKVCPKCKLEATKNASAF